jgi:valyl-tRNA synthetase
MSAEELPPRYDPKRAEERWYAEWEARADFTPDMKSEAPTYSIVIPPPNVTGYLHMGHALQHTLMDILVRRKRMQGFRALWLPGTDHAGISTQVVVERQLKEQGISRHELGREEFERRVWAWREHSGGTIQRQIRREGASVDWTRERFTLDEGLSHAVREVFVSLYEEGLIYRGPRLVNWCVNHGALSDLESPKEETKGALYEIFYPVAGSDERVMVVTTRPETMLGDTAIAVHPDDERYKHLIGRTAILPLVGREIPFIADEAVEREFGTGAVKVTPAHDPADFEIGQRHHLPQVTVIGFDGRMTHAAGDRFANLDRFEARQRVVEALQEEGLLGNVAEYKHQVPRCDRCKTIIEPLISEQWFLEVKGMADVALQAVRDGHTRFIPERWTKVYTDWMENIQPWCISRQLWWGHRIPAWYCPDGHMTVSREDPRACSTCGSPDMRQDPDVLDTWFSSALWPFSTLGWPEKTRDLEIFYPTNVLVTGFDIIFFWVARMMMMGLKFMQDVPFREVLVTGLILDPHGEKMSKMKNNTVDPIDVFEKYGVDATRFTLAAAAQAGSDIKWRDDRVEEYRNFVNKIWNASRFVLMNLGDTDRAEWVDTEEAPASLADRWILSRFNRTARSVNNAIEDYRFHEAAGTLYHFFWDEFCSWYIELSKPLVASREVTGEVLAARQRIAHVLEMSLRLLSPFMPYVTEEIWQRLPHEGDTVGLAPYPGGDENAVDEKVEADMGYVIELITKVRNIRSEMNLPRQPLRLYVATTDGRVRSLVRSNEPDIVRLANLEALEVVEALPELGVAGRDVLAGAELAVPLEGLIDVAAERARLERERDKAAGERGPLAKKLENANFVERAAREVVDATRARVSELDARISRLGELVEALR